jgi:anti-anti-sigma regulatory factor
MATQITQIDGTNTVSVILRVKGELLIEDAHLIGRISRDLANEGRDVTLDLADIDFLDSESASVLRSLEFEGIFEMVGLEIFLQHAVNAAERG